MKNRCPTITASAGMSGNNQPIVCLGVDLYNQALTGDKSKCMTNKATDSDYAPHVLTFEPGIASREGGHVYEGVSGTLRAKPGDNQLSVVYATNQQGGAEVLQKEQTSDE